MTESQNGSPNRVNSSVAFACARAASIKKQRGAQSNKNSTSEPIQHSSEESVGRISSFLFDHKISGMIGLVGGFAGGTAASYFVLDAALASMSDGAALGLSFSMAIPLIAACAAVGGLFGVLCSYVWDKYGKEAEAGKSQSTSSTASNSTPSGGGSPSVAEGVHAYTSLHS